MNGIISLIHEELFKNIKPEITCSIRVNSRCEEQIIKDLEKATKVKMTNPIKDVNRSTFTKVLGALAKMNGVISIRMKIQHEYKKVQSMKTELPVAFPGEDVLITAKFEDITVDTLIKVSVITPKKIEYKMVLSGHTFSMFFSAAESSAIAEQIESKINDVITYY